MTSENKICQNCKQKFVIEPEDFNFYEKIKVPPPTWCPECRHLRRMSFRNERSLYHNFCGLCNREIIAVFAKSSPCAVYCQDCWKSDKWNPLDYGKEYDFSKTFFEQLHELLKRTPRPNLEGTQNLNCPYTNYTWLSKNCYLSPSTLSSENVYYSKNIDNAKECIDCLEMQNAELCYELLYAKNCHNSIYLAHSTDCVDSAFLYACRNCTDCILSSNLRNKRYVIRNIQYSREEYEKKRKEILNGNFSTLSNLKEEFLRIRERALNKYAWILKANNATGDNLTNVKDVFQCFDAYNVQNLRYAVRGYNTKDSGDLYGFGTGDSMSELMYEGVNVGLADSIDKFSTNTHTNNVDIQYSDYCRSSFHLFGCVSLHSKQYCILNKQYSKEEYEALVPKIIEHMNTMPYVDSLGRVYKYGEFFPLELSPFSYNETIAQEYFPLTKAQALEKGYRWRDPETKHYTVTKKPDELPDNIKDVDDSILNEVIGCAHEGKCNEQCTTAFKIIPQELQFYKRMSLPLPRLCPNCRHYQRLKQRNPLNLWHRICTCVGAKSDNGVYTNTISHFHGADHCPNEFETSYAPDRPEIVYCENCYNSEVV